MLTLMLNIRKKIIFSFISSLMILSLLACSSEATPESPDIEATVQARVKTALDSMPTPEPPTPISTSTPTPAPTATPTPTSKPTPPTLTATPISIPIITPIPTPTTETPIPLLEAFEARIDIVLQVDAAVHNVTWNLINNSQQKVKVVGEIRRANGTIIARAESSGFVDPNGKIGSFGTTFITTPTQEEVMAFQWVWTIQTQTGETIVCTFTKANPKSCVYTSTSTPTPTATPAMGSTASVTVMNYSFSSKTVTISQGGTVTWNFNSGSHSTTRTGSESWDSGVQVVHMNVHFIIKVLFHMYVKYMHL